MEAGGERRGQRGRQSALATMTKGHFLALLTKWLQYRPQSLAKDETESPGTSRRTPLLHAPSSALSYPEWEQGHLSALLLTLTSPLRFNAEYLYTMSKAH